jgi:anti-sigma-K factor RskA
MDLLAAEYVLGVLDAGERARTQALIHRNGTMRILVEAWEDRFSPLDAGYPVLAAPDVWRDLDRALFAPQRRRNRVFLLVVSVLAVALVVKMVFWARLLM